MPDVKHFLEMPYKRQLHLCILRWLRTQNILPYQNGKLVREYFVCRSVLLKKDRQTVKNIALMLSEAQSPVPLFDLEHQVNLFIRHQQQLSRQNLSCSRKEYPICLEDFLHHA